MKQVKTKIKAKETLLENPIKFTLTIAWGTVEAAYRSYLDKLVADAEIKGFRKGKAPRKIVEDKVGKKRIYGEVVEKVLPPAYREEIKKRGIKPMIAPRVLPIKLEEKQTWEFEIAVVVKPEVKLGDWEKTIKNKLAPTKVIKPGEENKDDATRQNEKMGAVFDALLESVEVELPQMLVDEEVNLQLTKLIDQVGSVGMTMEQYLRSKKMTHQQIRAGYEKTAREMLRLNLALDAIASVQNITEKDRIAKAVEYLTSL